MTDTVKWYQQRRAESALSLILLQQDFHLVEDTHDGVQYYIASKDGAGFIVILTVCKTLKNAQEKHEPSAPQLDYLKLPRHYANAFVSPVNGNIKLFLSPELFALVDSTDPDIGIAKL